MLEPLVGTSCSHIRLCSVYVIALQHTVTPILNLRGCAVVYSVVHFGAISGVGGLVGSVSHDVIGYCDCYVINLTKLV